MTLGCSNRRKLMEATQRPAILYTLSRGPLATYSVGLRCDGKSHYVVVDLYTSHHASLSCELPPCVLCGLQRPET